MKPEKHNGKIRNLEYNPQNNNNEIEPEDLREGTNRKRAYEYIRENPYCDTPEITANTRAPPNIGTVLFKKGLVSRRMNRKIARYEYFVKSEVEDDE